MRHKMQESSKQIIVERHGERERERERERENIRPAEKITLQKMRKISVKIRQRDEERANEGNA